MQFGDPNRNSLNRLLWRNDAKKRPLPFSVRHRVVGGQVRVRLVLGRMQVLFAPLGAKPRLALECDSIGSLTLEVEAGRGIAVVASVVKRTAGKRLCYRPLTGTTEALAVGIARATRGGTSPRPERGCAPFCGRLREGGGYPNLSPEGALELSPGFYPGKWVLSPT